MITAWLRMSAGGDFATCEEAYTANQTIFDIVHPTHGGKLKADGTWEQESWKFKGFGEALPDIVKENNQLYIPCVADYKNEMVAFLNNPGVWQKAVDGLIDLMFNRFDGEWDGVMLDLEKHLTEETKDALSQFYYLISYEVRRRNKLLFISVRGHDGTMRDYPDAYGHDFSVVAKCADYVDYRLYGYWRPKPQTRAPYYWCVDSIEYALSQGMRADQLIFGSGTFSAMFVDGVKSELPYQKVMEIAKDIWFMNENENGILSESYSLTDDGEIWIADYHTVKRDCELAEQYGLAGIALFTPSGSSNGVFEALNGSARY